MRVFAISHSCVVRGYQERFRALARLGVDVTLLTPARWLQATRLVEAPPAVTEPGIRTIVRQPWTFMARSARVRNAVHIYAGLGALVAAAAPDLLEVWEEPFFAVTFQALLARHRTPGTKVVVFSAQNIRKSYPPPFCWFEGYVLSRTDYVYLMNEEVRCVLASKGWRGRGAVLPLGVSTIEFSPERRDSALAARLRAGATSLVGFLGKLDPQKGAHVLIETAASLPAGARLLLIGSGRELTALKAQARTAGLADRVRFEEAVDYDRVPAYLTALDLLVVPSLTTPGLKEQFGRIAVEAMACGVPVVCSNSGELPNVVGDAGVVVPEGSAEALGRALSELLASPERRAALAERGHALVRERYTWEAVAAAQVRIYEELVSELAVPHP